MCESAFILLIIVVKTRLLHCWKVKFQIRGYTESNNKFIVRYRRYGLERVLEGLFDMMCDIFNCNWDATRWQ